MLEVCRDTLQRLPEVAIETAADGRTAAARCQRETWDLLITDVRMPGLDGVDLLRTARQADPTLAVLMMTAFPSVETAVQAMKLGAADYLTKPFLPEDLLATVTRLLETHRLSAENRLLTRRVEQTHRFGEMLGVSPAMHTVFDLITRVAPTNADVLIIGQTGTGKELVARSVHQRSPRAARRFVPVDCGAIPEDLLESELFGHERGAFTGAHSRSLGLLEFADGGTFFLDEVGELPPRLQVKLLRALQERSIRRVGGKDQIPVDVRVIAATSRDLAREVEAQRFRSDLYYRIHVARIDLPPLCQRPEDIPVLVAHFVERCAAEMGKAPPRLQAQVLEVLAGYPWPGNVRELQNVIKRTLALAPGPEISVDDLPDEVVNQATTAGGQGTPGFFDRRARHLEQFEKDYFIRLLQDCQGDASQAAAQARIPRGTLYRLLKKHGINPAEFRG